jgi:hypothetical protein
MADNKNFFEEPQEEIQEEPQTFKLGDKEYSQDDLSRLVGLGEIASEAEEKYKTKIDRVWPEYTKATQKMSDYERKIAELEAKVTQPTQQQPSNMELTAEQKALARKQIEDLGFGQDNFRAIVREELAAKELLSDIDSLMFDAKENGQPVTTQRELLQHMSETGIKNPAKAYKDMFETELDAIKEKKIAEIRPQGMTTTHGSQAGGKQPAPVKVTRANLNDLVASALGRE